MVKTLARKQEVFWTEMYMLTHQGECHRTPGIGESPKDSMEVSEAPWKSSCLSSISINVVGM